MPPSPEQSSIMLVVRTKRTKVRIRNIKQAWPQKKPPIYAHEGTDDLQMFFRFVIRGRHTDRQGSREIGSFGQKARKRVIFVDSPVLSLPQKGQRANKQ